LNIQVFGRTSRGRKQKAVRFWGKFAKWLNERDEIALYFKDKAI